MSQQTCTLGSYEPAIRQALKQAGGTGVARRLWEGDVHLWSGRDENRWLGWLRIVEQQLAQKSVFASVTEDIRGAGFTDALLLGMGGSSLCPEVMRMTFGKINGYPELHVLDSTVPAQVRAFEKRVDLSRTVCVVASKSGSTTEPNVFRDYFYERIQHMVGDDKAGYHFIAITDPGSAMEADARQRKFRHILHGVPEIGGRYSALSHFGLIPSAIMGVDVPTLLERADKMARACGPLTPAPDNPGLVLGLTLGHLALAGRDKVSIITAPAIWDLGAWMEQLIAESTGKEGKGLVPIDNEPVGTPDVYGNDRVFVHIRMASNPDEEQDRAVAALEMAGHPVARITLDDAMDIGAEFFRWEIATAVAGHVLGINPFDQPNVQESKDYTKNLTDAYEKTGSLPVEEPVLASEGIRLYTDTDNAAALSSLAAASGFPEGSVESWIAAHLGRLNAGDYAGMNVYVEMSREHQALVQNIRQKIRDRKRVATTVGYGPRFLHSTGQLHKGGPNSGVFTQITCEDASDLAIPGRRFSFGTLKAAQATGDFLALSSRKRRLLRIHLPADVFAGLTRIRQAVETVLG